MLDACTHLALELSHASLLPGHGLKLAYSIGHMVKLGAHFRAQGLWGVPRKTCFQKGLLDSSPNKLDK